MKSINQAPNNDKSLLAARQARLKYVSDHARGIERIKRGAGFRYRDQRGFISDAAQLARIRKLAIPPAWTDVWICLNPLGHLQATGRDQRGRKQYRYHERWRIVRDEHKFHRILKFAEALPRIRRRVRRDLKLPGVPREKVLATVVRLLESTLVRVGNSEYAKQNHSYGLTTLRDSHVRIRKGEIRLEFRGKGGKWRRIRVHDPRLARIVKRCQDIPGQELFQFLDEAGKRHAISSTDVNRYLQEAAGAEYTAKDYRTWYGTLLALRAFRSCIKCAAAPTKRNLKRCIEDVANQLGNTPAICRKCYIHPGLVEAFLKGTLSEQLDRPSARASKRRADEADLLRWLRAAARRQPSSHKPTQAERRLAACLRG
jgi:DNA topoisomerase I